MEIQKIKQAINDNNLGSEKIYLVTSDTGILYYPIAIVGAEIIVLREDGTPNELNATYNILKGYDFIKHIDYNLLDRHDILEADDYMMGDVFKTDDGIAFYLERMY